MALMQGIKNMGLYEAAFHLLAIICGLVAIAGNIVFGIGTAIFEFLAWLAASIEGRKKGHRIKELEGAVADLETQINPRQLKGSSGGDIAVALQAFHGQKVDMTFAVYNPEAESFCNDLASAFATVGLDIHKRPPQVTDVLSSKRLSFAVKLKGGVQISYAESRELLAKAIFTALSNEKISVGPIRVMDGSYEDDFQYGQDSLVVHVSQKDA